MKDKSLRRHYIYNGVNAYVHSHCQPCPYFVGEETPFHVNRFRLLLFRLVVFFVRAFVDSMRKVVRE